MRTILCLCRWDAAGPYRVIKHLQNHSVMCYSHEDGKAPTEAYGHLDTPPSGVSDGAQLWPGDSI